MKTTPIRTRIAAGTFFVVMSGGLVSLSATEKQIADLEEDIAALKVELEEVSASGGAATQLLSNIETAKAEMEKTSAALPEKETALAAKSYLLGIYQSAFRVVTTMVAGEDLGTIQLSNGEVIPGASFLRTEKGAILVQTGTGSRSLPISQLPATLSGKLQLPPNITAPGTTFEAVKATKPTRLQTKEEIAAAGAQEPVVSAGMVAAPNSVGSTGGKVNSAPLSAAATESALRQRNAAREKQLLELKIRYAEVFKEKKDARAARAQADSEFRQAKIKKAKTIIDAEMARHDARIDAIEEEESQLRAEMARIQASFE